MYVSALVAGNKKKRKERDAMLCLYGKLLFMRCVRKRFLRVVTKKKTMSAKIVHGTGVRYFLFIEGEEYVYLVIKRHLFFTGENYE